MQAANEVQHICLIDIVAIICTKMSGKLLRLTISDKGC